MDLPQDDGPAALPPHVSPPLATDSEHNHSGSVVIVTSLLLAVSLASLLIRCYVATCRRLKATRDDFILLAAWGLLCIESALVFVQVRDGWGKAIKLLDQPLQESLLKFVFATDILYILVLYLSKLSAALFYLRVISPGSVLIHVVRAICGISSLWALISVLLVTLRCDMGHPWTDITAECSTLTPRWQAICSIDIILEIAIAAISVFLVYRTRLPPKHKVVVVLAFSTRLLTIIPSGLRLQFLQIQFHSSEPTHAGYAVTIAAQIQLGYAIVANTIPCLKPFVAAYESAAQEFSFRGYTRHDSGGGGGGGGAGAAAEGVTTTNTTATTAATTKMVPTSSAELGVDPTGNADTDTLFEMAHQVPSSTGRRSRKIWKWQMDRRS